MTTLLPTDLPTTAEELASLCTAGQDFLDRPLNERSHTLATTFINRLKVRLIELFIDAGVTSVEPA